MQIVSDAVKHLVDSYAKVKLSVLVEGAQVRNGVGSCNYTVECGTDEAFSFGNACAAGVTVVVNKAMPAIKGLPIQVRWSVDGTWHSLLSGKIENVSVSAGRTTIQAWDAMFYGGNEVFVPAPSVCSDCDAAEAFFEIAQAIGVSADTASIELLRGITIIGGLAGIPEGSTKSFVAGHIAGLVGGNAIITRDGQLAVKCYVQTGWKTEPYAGGASAQNSEYSITGITFLRDETVTMMNPDGTSTSETHTYEYYAGDGSLVVSNPLADQAAADRAYKNLSGLSIRPGRYAFPGGLLIEPGDIITVESMNGNYQVAAVMVSMNFDGGVSTEVRCGGAVPSGGATGFINQALKALFADFAKLRTLVVDTATITNARISNLRVEDIVAGRIRSTDYQSMMLEEIFPAESIYPSEVLFPSNGEEIVRGLEIDFEAGVIRGVFHSVVTDRLQQRLDMMEERIASIEATLN